jgi:type IV secretory pathway TraG/TraD family ATPase VirD4
MSLLNDHRSARPPAQDLVPLVLLCALAGVVLTGMAVLMSAAAVGTVLLGGPAELPAPPTWGPRVWSVLVHPDDPGAALPAPWSVLAGHAGLYWVLTATMGLAAMAVLGMIGIWIWVQFGPTSPGHASRRQLRAELSVDAARDRARVTRPSMSPAQRRSAAPTEVGVPMHLGPIGALYAPLENPTGAIAPTQSGKSRQDLVHKVIGAPGALLCSTTKPDLLEFAGIARARRLQGPVAVFDLTGSVSWPALLRWSPIQGCDKPIVADRRARTLVEAAAVQVESGGGTGAGNDKFFRERAVVVLSAYLLAAALDNKGVLSLIEWATNRQNLEPARILDARKFRDRADNLRAEIAVTPRTADGVWMSVRRVIEPLLDPRIRRMCSPTPGTGFDARSFLAAHGSLFLIAGQRQAAQAAPILTALAEYWIDTARDLALEAPARRLDPPATAVLDELPSATPIPSLPSTLADSAGRGVLIHWAAQAVSQLEETFGPGPAWSLLGNTRAITVWGGLVDPRTLEWLSTLFGHHERARWQEHSEGGFLSPTRSSLGTETVPTYRPGDVRQIGDGEVVIAYRNLGAILARTTDVARRPDWAQLRADIAAVRAGTAPISAAGYLNDEYLR